MNQDRATAAEARLTEALSGPDGLLVKLRNREGLDEGLLATVVAATEELIGEYADESTVPKSLALNFVDLSASLEGGWTFYDEATQERVEDARDTLVSLAYDLFGGQ
jgi:hypothetical protein